MKAASEHLTPVVLELGGKSPAIIMDDANIKMAAKRIVFGKFMNAGQTCVAPDYILIRKEIKAKFIEEVKKQIIKIHGSRPIDSEAFARIITKRHFSRLTNLIDNSKVVAGGDYDEAEKYIAPTLLDNISWDNAIMQEEIFGPILPIIEFENLDEAIIKIKEGEKPLALYIFSKNSKAINKICKEISFGGGMINDTLLHLANANIPFGGVGYSGMGNYHGKFGFDAFSHQKSLIYKTNVFEPFIKFPPYTNVKSNILKLLLE
jgi:aldehyde dehydrogenase (NAD+)